jgi:membrane-anchored protein YejM (alkaline phosphatase superfamily)
LSNPKKNLMIIHLESISWQQIRSFPEAFRNLLRIGARSQCFNWYISSATSTQMTISAMLHGNDFELDENISLANMQFANNDPSLFSFLKDAGYSSEFFALNACHSDSKPILTRFKDSLPPVRSYKDLSRLFNDMTKLFDAQPFAAYFWNMTTHVEQLAVQASVGGLSEQVNEAFSEADNLLGLVFDELEKRNLLDCTTLIIYGDHGDDYWTHGFHGGLIHATAPYFPIIHTPLFIYDTSLEAGVNNTFASTIDIYPTCIQLLQLDAELFFQHAGKNLFAVSGNYAFSQNLMGNQSDLDFFQVAKTFSVTNASYHLMVSRAGLEFYNHRLDPTNHCNLLNFFDLGKNGKITLRELDETHQHFNAAFKENAKQISNITEHFDNLRGVLMERVLQKSRYLQSKRMQPFNLFDPEVFFKVGI